jgi:RecA/RadA recombinase
MGVALVQHLKQIASEQHLNMLNHEFTTERILSRIYHYRVHESAELLALIYLLPLWLRDEYSRVKLIVIDSISAPFRNDFTEQFYERTRVLTNTAQDFMRIARQFGCAVVTTNQVTSRGRNNDTQLIPALGASWGHNCTNRFILYAENSVRYALLDKSPAYPSAKSSFAITRDGIRRFTE